MHITSHDVEKFSKSSYATPRPPEQHRGNGGPALAAGIKHLTLTMNSE